MPLSVSRVQERLRGVSAGLLTPFEEDLSVAHDRLQSNAQGLYERNVRSFLAVANISEYHSLSQSERIALAEASVDALPSDACVLAGVGGSTGDATELVEAYDSVGVDAMMVMPPDHTYLHERGLLDYYEELADATDRPLAPYVRGFDPSVEYLVALSELESVAAVKYAITDTTKLGAAVERGADDVVWVNGLAEPLAISAWVEGCEGFSAGVSNFRPEVGFALFDALSEGDWQRARRLRNICLPFQNFRDEEGSGNTVPGGLSIPALKKGLELVGLDGGDGRVREPLRPLSEAEERRAEQLYEQLDAGIAGLIDTQSAGGLA